MDKCNNGIIYLPSPYGGYYDGHPCPKCNGKGCSKLKVSVIDDNGMVDINRRMEIGKIYNIEIYYGRQHHPSTRKWVNNVKIYSIKQHGKYDIAYSTSDCYHWQGQSSQCMNISGWVEVISEQ